MSVATDKFCKPISVIALMIIAQAALLTTNTYAVFEPGVNNSNPTNTSRKETQNENFDKHSDEISKPNFTTPTPPSKIYENTKTPDTSLKPAQKKNTNDYENWLLGVTTLIGLTVCILWLRKKYYSHRTK